MSSPVLGAFRKLIAKVGGVFPGDLAAVAGARKQCFVNFTKGLVDTLQHATPDERARIKAGFTADLIAVGLGQAGANYKPFDYLLACVAFINGVERVYRAQANGAAGSSCAFSPITLSLSGRGTSTRLGSFDAGGPSALQTSCAASAGGLAISVAPTSMGTPLSSVVGPRLRLGIVRSKKDPAGGQLSVVFNQGSGAGSTTTGGSATSWTGDWNTDFGAMHLTQTGNNVTGSYAYCNGAATISGQVSGSTLDGTWTQPCNSKNGRIHFVFSTDGSSFTGTWGYGNATPTSAWNGTRA